MRFASFRADGQDRIGFQGADGLLYDLTNIAPSARAGFDPAAFTDMVKLIEAGPKALEIVQAAAADGLSASAAFQLDVIQWYAPLRKPSKIVCIPNNNTAFSETIIKRPKTTSFFLKTHSSIVAHNEPIVLLPEHGLTYPEPELAVVIGKTASKIKAVNAFDYIFGYTIFNDVTSASLREEDTFFYREAMPDGQGGFKMVESYTSYSGRYKSSDTFGPMGPWLVSKDEISNPNDLNVSCSIAGKLLYSDNTKNMTYHIPELLSVVTRYTTLYAGDVMSIGTASAPGGEEGEVPLSSTDIHRLGGPVLITIEKIGELSNPVTLQE
jgi:2-keto-4-pentenoate hydratase/2-oxohepta-3-ene-1,7-dioic acid hydratase in catechol pathway